MHTFLKKLFLLFIFMVCQNSFARPIVIQSISTSESQYNNFLANHENVISYSQHIQYQMQTNPSQESQLFRLSDMFNGNIKETIEAIKKIQSESPLTLTSLRFIRDLSQKALQQKNTPIEQSELITFYCKSSVLLEEGPLVYPCSQKRESLSLLKKYYPYINKVLLETVPVEVDGKNSLPLSAQAPYQWTLLSNTHVPIHFYGTFQQLLNQQLTSETLINGNCEGFTHQNLEMDILNEGMVFFSDTCVTKIKPLEEKKSWLSENRNLLLATGGVLAAALLYNYTKGKKITIDATALK
ncbi:MAG: hypothetical protein ACXVCP_10310 [Bdellovibrio sp.]